MFIIALIVFVLAVLLNMGTESKPDGSPNVFMIIGGIAFLAMLMGLIAGC